MKEPTAEYLVGQIIFFTIVGTAFYFGLTWLFDTVEGWL